MKTNTNIFYSYIATGIMLVASMASFAQDPEQQAPLSVPDTLNTKTSASRHSFFTGAGLGSNMIYMGSTISQNNPFGYAALSYGYNNELFVTLSAIHLTGFEPFAALYTASVNYNHVFNSWFDISSGIYRYNVAPSLTDTLFSSFNYGDLTLGFDWRLLYSKLSVSGLIADQSQVYFQIRNSRYFQTPEFSKRRVFISFDPYINIIFGTRTKASTITTTDTIVSIYPPFGPGRKKTQTSSTTTYSTTFGALEVDFGIPVTYNSGRATIEIEAGYVLPINPAPDYPSANGFLLLISGFFRIF